MKIDLFLCQYISRSSQISLLIILFVSLFSAPVVARNTQTSDLASISLKSNYNLVIAGKKVFVDRKGRRYVLNRFRRRVYLYPRAPKNYTPNGRIFSDRKGRRYILKRNGRKVYL